MNRYQIRVPENFAVEDVIEEMAGKAWDQIIHCLDPTAIYVPLKNYRHFKNALYRAATPHLRNYALCGLPDFCLECCSSGPFDNTIQRKPGVDDRIFHIFVETDIEPFIDDLVAKAFETLERIIKPERTEAVLCYIREIFVSVLGEYLYTNRMCGKTLFCDYSESAMAVTA